MKKTAFYYKFYNLFLCLVLLISISVFYKTKIEQLNIQENYRHYHDYLEIKAVLLNDLEYNLGFGGFIHHFKNYLIRAQIKDYQAAKVHLVEIETLCDKYKSLQLSLDEKKALQNILGVLKQYQQSLAFINESFQKPHYIPIQELDGIVKIDDSPLIKSISLLKQVLLQEHEAFYQARQQNMFDRSSSVSLLLFLVFPLLLITWLFITRLVSFKTKQLDQETLINKQLLQELKLTAAVFDSHEGIIITNPDKEIIKANKAICLLTGYKEDELLGKTPKVLSSDKQSLFFYAKLWQSVYAQGSWSGEIVDLKNNGDTFVAWLSINTVLDKQGDIKYFLAHFTDLTDYKSSQAALSRRITIEKTISDVAIRMLKATSDSFDAAIIQCLQLLSTELDADRGYLFKLSADTQFMTNTHEWCAEGIESMIDSLQAMEVDSYSWLMAQLFSKKVVSIADIDNLPAEAMTEKVEMQRQSIQSILFIPISDGIKLTGYFGFDRVKEQRAWRDEDIALFQMIAEIFYLAEYRHEIECLNANYLEETTGLLYTNTELLNENRNLTSRTIEKIEEERHFLAQELHDEMGQHITAIRMNAEYLKTFSYAQDNEKVLKILNSIDSLTVKVINNLRATILRIRSATLDHLGLVPALKELVEEWLHHNQDIIVNSEFMDGLDKLDENTKVALYRVAQEALTNISKYAEAHQVSIILSQMSKSNKDDFLRLVIADDGVGIQVNDDSKAGFGLIGMKERIRALGGGFSISGNEKGAGTRLEFTVPYITET